ncbi:MAG: phosphoribosyltransferase [Pseudomonadota bacterium]
MWFQDRSDAGQKLARALMAFKQSDPVVLALPRGGLPVAAEVAVALGAPLDIFLVRKIGLPTQPELAMGAVADGATPVVVHNEAVIASAGVSQDVFEQATRRELAEIARRRQRFLGDRPPADLRGKTVILVDDGVATGATMMVAVEAVRRQQPRQVVVAAPAMSPEAAGSLRRMADALVSLTTPGDFEAVGCHYRDFRQLDDADVVAILQRFRAVPSTATA